MSDTKSAISRANQAVSIYEQLSAVRDALKDLQQNVRVQKPEQTETEVSFIYERVLAVLPLFDRDSELPLLSSHLAITASRSTIERLGLSKEIVALATQRKFSPSQIEAHFKAKSIDLPCEMIRAFLKHFERASYAERVRQQTTSVFDTSSQLERLLATIDTQLGRLAYSIDPKQQDVHRGYVAELRQVIKLASDLQFKVREQQQQEEFRSAVKQVLLSVCTPEQRSVVYERLRAFNDFQALTSVNNED